VFGGQLLGQFIQIVLATCIDEAVKSRHVVRREVRGALIGYGAGRVSISAAFGPTIRSCCSSRQLHCGTPAG
jgi:hypothetical protein